jgi:antibiotic biosynthesis monooxygenase (ABM) superfamily enzyme
VSSFHLSGSYTKQGNSSMRPSQRATPPRYKMFLLTWLAIYPLITAILWLFSSFLALFPLPLRTLILTGVLVYLMTYIVMPKLMKLFYRWLNSN